MAGPWEDYRPAKPAAADGPWSDYAATPPAPAPKSSAIRRGIGDVGVSALKGAVAVPEAAVGLADIVTGGRVGRALENAGGSIGFRPKEARAALDDLYSPEQQAANKAVQDAQGFLPTLEASITNPSTIGHSVIESLPQMLAGGLVGRGITKAVPSVGRVLGVGAGEGIVGAGSQAESIRQQTNDGLLTPKQSALAAGTGATTGIITAGSGRLANRFGIGDIDQMILTGQMGAGAAKKGVLRRAGEGVLTEGVLEEAPQSGAEQALQNVALDRPVGEGVGSAMAQGLLSGSLMGGIAGPLVRSPGPSIDQPKSAVPGQPTPPAPGAPPAQTPGDAIRATAPPVSGPLTGALNAGIEQQAQAADAALPVGLAQELTGNDAVRAVADASPNESRLAMRRQQAELASAPPPDLDALVEEARAVGGKGRPRAASLIPTGEAEEIDVQAIQPGDILAKDGEPYGSLTSAKAKASETPSARVVSIPNHFGSGTPGYVVRPIIDAQPNNTRGTTAADLPRARNVDQRNLAGVASESAAPGDGGRASAVGSGLAVGSVPAQPGAVVLPAPRAEPGAGPAKAVGNGRGADGSLSPLQLRQAWSAAAARGDTAEAARLNDLIKQAKKAQAAPSPAEGVSAPPKEAPNGNQARTQGPAPSTGQDAAQGSDANEDADARTLKGRQAAVARAQGGSDPQPAPVSQPKPEASPAPGAAVSQPGAAADDQPTTAKDRREAARQAQQDKEAAAGIVTWQRLPARDDLPGSLRHRFTTSEGMDGQVLVSPPGWRKGVKSFVVSFDRTGGALDDKGRTKFYPTVDIGKYRTEEAARIAAEKVIADNRKAAPAAAQPAPTPATSAPAAPASESAAPASDQQVPPAPQVSTQTDAAPKPKVHKSRAGAEAARTGNTQRLRKVKGGFILRNASDKELAAAERAGRRLASGGGVDVDKDSLLVAIARLGGLSMKERSDTIGEGNRNIAGKMLFTLRGQAIDLMASGALREYGYVPADQIDYDGGVSWLRDAIKDEFMGSRQHFSEQGTGWMEDRAGRAMMTDEENEAARIAYEEEEAARLADWSVDDLADAGYTAISPEAQQATEELLAQAEALGIDIAAIRENADHETRGQPDDAYHAEVQRVAREAIAAAGRNAQGAVAQGPGGRDQDGGESAGDQGEAQGLNLEAPTRAQVLAQQDALEQERADREAPPDTPRSRLTGEQVDIFNPQGSVFDAAPEPEAPAAQSAAPAPAAEPAAPKTLRERVAAAKERAANATKTPTVDAHLELFKAVRAGTATPDEFKAMYRRVRDGKDAITAELNTSTKDELLKNVGGYLRPGTTKTELVDAIYKGLLHRFALGKDYGPNSYMMGQEKAYEKAKRDAFDALVEGQTDESLAEYAAELKAEFDAAMTTRTARLDAIKDPKTLDDFRSFVTYHLREGKTERELRFMLTPEQRANMDELNAEYTRGQRTTAKDEQRTQVRVAGQTVDGDIIATKHTKKGTDLYVVKLAERVSREDYDTLNAGAKRIGGYYSSFRGGGAIPGFQFTTREQAQAFVTLAGGDNTAAVAAAQERRDAFQDDRSQSASERLTEMADRLEERADESLGRERQANTERRARFAASAEASAQSDKAMAKTMRNIAGAITDGTAKFLDRVRQKVQVEMLQGYVRSAKDSELRAKHESYHEQEKHRGERPTGETADYAEFPEFTAYRSDLASLGRQLLEVDGTKLLGQRMMKVADDVSDAYLAFAKEPANLFKLSTFSVKSGEDRKTAIFPSKDTAERAISRSGLSGKAIAFQEKRGVHRIIMSPSLAMEQGVWKGDGDKRITLSDEFGTELVEKIGRANRRGAKVSVPWQFESAYDRRKALARMGIERTAEFRAALREFIGLREAAAAPDKVKQMERAMVGRRNDGLDFFPTPEATADAMVEAADIQPGMRVLEPSAGMGHIAERIRDAGVEPLVAEVSGDRRELLEAKGFELAGSDFMAITEGGYDRILMNPPFSDGRDIQHVRHAYDLLKPGGRLVALMGESAFTNQNKRATEFREWLESVGGTEEKLAEGTFNDPSLPVNTGANARMVVIEKPGAEPVTRFSRETAAPTRATASDITRVTNTAEAIASAWANKPDIVVFGDMQDDDVPKEVRARDAQQRSQGATGEPRAFYAGGKVYLHAGMLRTPMDVSEALYHEVLGHSGLRGHFGPELDRVLDQMAALYNPATMQAKAVEYGQAITDANGKFVRYRSEQAKRVTAEEVLAELSQSKPGSLMVRRAIAAIRAFLREHVPGFSDLKLTDADVIERFIAPARGFIERGRAAARPGAETVFQRVWHGTTARDIERFSTDYLGAGTGDQAFGWGLYFAGRREVGEYYRRLLTEDKTAGQLYGVEIPEDSEMLDWNLRLSQQPAGVRATLERADFNGDAVVAAWKKNGAWEHSTGETLYRHIAGGLTYGAKASGADRAASLYLASIGVRGIKYRGKAAFDKGTAGAANYVIFDGADTEIQEAMFSRTPDQTKTEAFRKWFGASKVVDAQGKPLVVYHGTAADFSVFLGKAQFFSSSADSAATFGNDRAVMPAYLNLRNPAGRAVLDGMGIQPSDLNEPSSTGAKRLIAKGYDGVIVEYRPGVKTYIAFRPEQIKSATGNSGAFSPDTADIRFSREPTAGELWDVAKSANTPAKARAAFLGATENINRFNLWDKTIGTQLNMARKDKHFARVFEGFQQQQDDTAAFAIEAEAEAIDVLARMSGAKETVGSLKATFSGERSKDLNAVSKAIFSNIEGETGVKQKVFTDAELAQDFGLNARQIGQYRQARAAVDQSLDRYAQSLVVRVAQKFVGTEDFRRAGLDETADELLGRLNFRRDQFVEARDSDPINGAIEFDSLTPAERVELTHASATKLLNDKIEALDAAIEQIPGIQKTANDLKAAGYAPAMRFGDYAVTATNPDGTVEFFAMVDNKMQANLLRMRLRQELPGTNITANAVDKESFKIFGGMSPDTVELFAKFLEVDKTDAFKEFVALAASSRSALKHMLERKGIAGFSQNLPQVLAAFITSNSRAAARNLNGEEVAAAMESVKKNANGDVSEQAAKLHQYMQNPTDDGAKIRGFMFAYFMGGSVASALVNLTQPLMMTAPYLHQFAGAKVAAIMGRAAKTAATGETANMALRLAMAKAASEGVTDTHEYYQMMQEAGGSGNVPVRAAMKAWGAMFGAAEKFNRKITFAAAFEVAQGMTEAQIKVAGATDAYSFAKRAVDETQGIYARHNRPTWARGTAGALLMTFKQFSIAYVEFFMRLPTQQKMIALALLVLMAGAEGLPFAEDLEDLIDTLGQKMGYGTNTKKALRQAATALLGDAGAQFALHGITGISGLPMDIAGRLGMGNLLPGTKLFNPSVRDKSREVLDIAGPAGGMAKKALEAVDTADPTRAFPSAMANAAKALQMFSTGQYRDTANKRVQDVDGMDATMKLIGFQPQSVAAGSRRMAEDMRDVDTVRRVESEIVAQWAEGMRSRDQEAIKNARERLKDWNADNPDLPIKIKLSQVVAKVKALSSTRDQRFMKSAPPEMRRKLMAESQ